MIGIVSLINIEPYQSELFRNVILQIKEFVDDAVLIILGGASNTDRGLRGYVDNIDIIKLDLYSAETSNWSEQSDYIDRFLQGYNFETIFVINTAILFKSYYNDLIYTYENKIKYGIDCGPRYGFKKNNVRGINNRICFMDRVAANNIKVIHFALSPQEPDWSEYMNFKSYSRYSFLKDGKYNYAPMYERSLFLENEEFNRERGKRRSRKFIFYCSRLNENRDFVYDMQTKFQKEKNLNFRVFDERKKFSQYMYYQKLAAYRYTLIIKSNYEGYFSIKRFFEAIARKCVPLILDDVDTTMLQNTFPDIYDVILYYDLILPERRVKARINHYDKDKRFIDDVKATKSFKKITDYDSVEKFYNKLMEAVK
jgi:hypothetical protein